MVVLCRNFDLLFQAFISKCLLWAHVLVHELRILIIVSCMCITVSCAIILFRFIPWVGCSSEGLHGTSAALLTVIKVWANRVLCRCKIIGSVMNWISFVNAKMLLAGSLIASLLLIWPEWGNLCLFSDSHQCWLPVFVVLLEAKFAAMSWSTEVYSWSKVIRNVLRREKSSTLIPVSPKFGDYLTWVDDFWRVLDLDVYIRGVLGTNVYWL